MGAKYSVADYSINRRNCLGRGAYGTVYRAKDYNGTEVAAKKFNKDSRGALEQLQNCEYIQLNHKNIVKILGVCKDGKHLLWMFLEYCNGGDLNSYARAHFQKFSGSKLMIMRQIAEGINFLHDDLRIAHRDMKPENILIQHQARKQPITVKLTDIGWATYSSVTHINLGTKAYKAPEFWYSNEEALKYDKNGDVYAMGLIFLAMLQAR